MFRADQMAVYFHWPFCASKCPYCDFNSHVRDNVDQSRMLAAYQKSIEMYASQLPEREIVSVFFGGGTPSLMLPSTVSGIIDTLQRKWKVANDLEITLEANPTSVEAEKFSDFKSAGVTRVSMGVQALNEADLKFLGRTHGVEDALRAIDIAGRYFDRYSFDLIYGRPEQKLADWEKELRRAGELARGHLSLYQLTIERNTPFYMQYHRGAFSIPDEVMGAEFYHLTQDVMEGMGMPAYEVSNHAGIGQECRHNLVYWHYADYVGIGAGAHGRFMRDGCKYATRDHAAPEKWLERVEEYGHGAHPSEIISPQDRFAEALMMGLRLRDGVTVARLQEISGEDFFKQIDVSKLDRVIQEGWAVLDGTSLRLTREGMLRLNVIIPYILKDTEA